MELFAVIGFIVAVTLGVTAYIKEVKEIEKIY
jgi:hypothetical protein